MSRHGYCELDEDPLQLGRWRAQVASAIRGARGQKLLREMRDALDAMPEKRLISSELEQDGEVCALGAVGKFRGIDMQNIDPEEPEQVAAAFDIAEQLAREITYENDDYHYSKPEQRWKHMRAWVEKHIKPEESKP